MSPLHSYLDANAQLMRPTGGGAEDVNPEEAGFHFQGRLLWLQLGYGRDEL